MSRNGSGTYSLPVNSWNPATNSTPATSADWQALANDIAAALTQSISKDGQTPITSTIPFADITVVNFTFSGTLTGGTGVLNIGSGQIYKTTGGIVGVGTATPTAIGGNIQTVQLTGTDGGGIKLTQGSTINGTFYSSVNEVLIGADAASGVMRFLVAGVDAARFTNGRDLLVGTSSGAVSARVVANNPTAAVAAIAAWNADTVGDNLFHVFNTEAGGTLRGTIDYNRGAGLVRYNTTSDGNLKNIKNVANLDDSVALIMSIPIDEWAWKDDENQWSQVGPIAQKLHAVFPGAVSVGGDYEAVIPATYDEEGNELTPESTETKYRPWAVDKTAPVWHLVATCQKQQAIITAQQAQIDSILQRVAALENGV